MNSTFMQTPARWNRIERLSLIGPYPHGRDPVGGVESVSRALVELLLEAGIHQRVGKAGNGVVGRRWNSDLQRTSTGGDADD